MKRFHVRHFAHIRVLIIYELNYSGLTFEKKKKLLRFRKIKATCDYT